MGSAELPIIEPVDFNLLPQPIPLSRDEIKELKKFHPFLYGLLYETGLTTPLLAKRLKKPLQNRRCLTPFSTQMIRRHLLYTDSEAIESSEILFHPPFPLWTDISEPLGPWLKSNGFSFSKQNIFPFSLELTKELQNFFGKAPVSSRIFGRQYDFVIHSPFSTPTTLLVKEIWNPILYKD